jgi:hypothetical protein
LEVWPGSHVRDTAAKGADAFHTGTVNLSSEEIYDINVKGSKRMLLKAGSILIRDQRLVHRGTANTSQEPRPCLSLWYKGNAGKFRPMELNLPIPHRSLADKIAKIAFEMREAGRNHVDNRQNKPLVNLGSLLGRLVEEFSASDRDYRRVIPAEVFDKLSDKSRHLLRFSKIAPESVQAKKLKINYSMLGSGLLVLITSVFVFLGVNALLFAQRGEVKNIAMDVMGDKELWK